MRHRLRSYSLTPAGGALILLLVAAILVLLLGPKHDEVPAFIVIVVVMMLLVIGGNPGMGRRSRSRTLGQYRGQFRARERFAKDEPEASANEDMWRRERERRSEKDG